METVTQRGINGLLAGFARRYARGRGVLDLALAAAQGLSAWIDRRDVWAPAEQRLTFEQRLQRTGRIRYR